MNFLFLGDIMGRSGRNIVISKLPDLIKKHQINFVVANGENSAGGFGITQAICNELFDVGVDVITSGNHIWDQKETMDFIREEKRLLRPWNWGEGTPGSGFEIFEKNNLKIGVMNLMGNVYMKKTDAVFPFIEEKIKQIRLKQEVDFLLVDIHAEITSEKQAMGYFLDGKATLVVGTHTHTPTLDFRVLEGGTAYQTDAGMCGDYKTIIGMDRDAALKRFFTGVRGERLQPGSGEGTISGIKIVGDIKTGLAKAIEPIIIGANLTKQFT